MKIVTKLFVMSAVLGFQLISSSSVALAATSPNLGQAKSFVILSNTYSNTVAGTTLTGDLGYTTPPAVTPTVNGTTHMANATYNQAGIDQNAALSNLNSQPCTFNFAPGAVDLASDTTHGPVGVYTPGVYCITGGDSVGGGGTITLTGAGTYIFRVDGAISTSANSIVQTANGASICDVWWTPTQATTLGANSTFIGTVIAAAGNTVGNNVNWTGRALSFGGTVSTAADTISAPNCPAPVVTAAATTVAAAATPGLPNTGLGEQSSSNSNVLIAAAVVISLTAIAFIRKKA